MNQSTTAIVRELTIICLSYSSKSSHHIESRTLEVWTRVKLPTAKFSVPLAWALNVLLLMPHLSQKAFQGIWWLLQGQVHLKSFTCNVEKWNCFQSNQKEQDSQNRMSMFSSATAQRWYLSAPSRPILEARRGMDLSSSIPSLLT